MSVWTNRALWILGIGGAFGYAYLVIGYPSGYELSRFHMQAQVFLVGLVAALLLRSWTSLVYVPAVLIFGIIIAGMASGVIVSFRQAVAGAFTMEVWLFGATALGALIATIAAKLLRRRLAHRAPPAGDARSA